MDTNTVDQKGVAGVAHWRGFALGSWGDSRHIHLTEGSEKWRGSQMTSGQSGQVYAKVV